MLHRLAILILLVTISFVSNAQRWNQRKYEFNYGIGMVNFNGDIAAPTDADKYAWINFFNTIGFTANTGMRYHLKDRHYVKGSLNLGQLYAADVPDNPKYYYRGYTMNSFFTELTVRYEFMVLQEKSRTTVYKQLGESKLKNVSIPTYLFIGAGGIFNVGSLKQANKTETTKENFANVAPLLSYGIGSKFRINRTTYGNIEFSGQLAISDGLDNAKGSESNQFGDYYDQYYFISINMIHKLRSNRKGLPKFKKR